MKVSNTKAMRVKSTISVILPTLSTYWWNTCRQQAVTLGHSSTPPTPHSASTCTKASNT
jgi:hypothetical protein